jgi:membrane protease YdiL (CAAX protease family)
MSDNNVDSSKKDKGWLYSDIYDRPNVEKNPLPRLSIFKFGTFRDVISNFGKWIAQITLYTMIFPVLSILLWPGPSGWGGDQIYLALAEIIKLVSFTISVFIITKFFDDRDIAEIGLKLNRRAVSQFFIGIKVAFLIIAFNFLVSWGAGWIEIQKVAWQTRTIGSLFLSILLIFVTYTFTGWSEELLFRGFHLRIISKGLNRPLGIILSSVIFAYAHHYNEGMTLVDYVFKFLFGIIMSIAFLRTGQLWLAIGLHTGWDFSVSMFGGTLISSLNIFYLMDIKAGELGIQFFQSLDFIIISIIVYLYTSRYKPETLDW